jgi:hypothetical protein
MFTAECSNCGSGLKDRDARCRLCKRDNPRFGKGDGRVASFAAAPPVAAPAPRPVPTLAVASATLTERVTAAETEPLFAVAALATPPAVPAKKQRGRPRKTAAPALPTLEPVVEPLALLPENAAALESGSEPVVEVDSANASCNAADE